MNSLIKVKKFRDKHSATIEQRKEILSSIIMEPLAHRGYFNWPKVNWSQIDSNMQTVPSPKDLHAEIIENNVLVELSNMASCNTNDGIEEPVSIFNLGDVVKRYWIWKECFPDFQPYYAVKCYDDPVVISLLSSLGAGFDCASKGEIELVLRLGVRPCDIIYANTIKFPSHLVYAEYNSISLMTVDNEEELIKIKKYYPTARLVLRLAAKTLVSVPYPLKDKFGCCPERVRNLLDKAQQLDLHVIGVSFHVGSGCSDANTYIEHIKMAKLVFEDAEEKGFHFSILDIGGGMYGSNGAEKILQKMSGKIRDVIDELFPASSGVRVIAEPGRYFVESALTVAACVIGKRTKDDLPKPGSNGDTIFRSQQQDGEQVIPSDHRQRCDFEYYLSESAFSTFRYALEITGYIYKPIILNKDNTIKKAYKSRLWGPTCDSIDLIQDCCHLPELHIGDWMAFTDVGSYTISEATNFNGMPLPKLRRVIHRDVWDKLLATVLQSPSMGPDH